jgi:hypothetical protein
MKHLGTWVPEFTEKLEEAAQTAFYKNLAKATRAFVEENLDLLSDVSNVGSIIARECAFKVRDGVRGPCPG